LTTHSSARKFTFTANEIPAGWFIVLEKKESKRRSAVGCEANAEA